MKTIPILSENCESEVPVVDRKGRPDVILTLLESFVLHPTVGSWWGERSPWGTAEELSF